MGERLRYIDYAKGLGIIFIVIGHLMHSAEWLIDWVYSFHVPLFFLISGMMIGRKDKKKGAFETIFKLVKSLIVPYIFFNMIGTSIPYIIGLKEFTRVGFNQEILLFFIGAGGSASWFLSSLFVAQVCFFFVGKIKNNYIRHIVSIIITVCGFILGNKIVFFISITRGMIGYSFLYIGYLISKNMEIRKRTVGDWNFIVGLILLFVNVLTTIINPRVDMHHFIFGNILLYYIENISGILFILFFCKKIENLRIKSLEYMGKNSIIIQCTHGLLGNIIIAFVIKEAGLFAETSNAIIVLLLELPLIYIITNYCGFIIGRKSLKRIKKAD